MRLEKVKVPSGDFGRVVGRFSNNFWLQLSEVKRSRSQLREQMVALYEKPVRLLMQDMIGKMGQMAD